MYNKFYDASLNIYFFKKVNIPLDIKLEYFFFNNQKYIILNNNNKNKFYFLIPTFLKIFYFNNSLYFNFIHFSSISVCKEKKNFLSHFLNKIFILRKITSKTIFIKGVGLRINLSDDSINTLKLKLGYSHLITLNFSTELLVSLFKKKILIRSFNQILLGNFCALLQKFRPLNVFTGKGLHLKRKKFKLKQYTKKI